MEEKLFELMTKMYSEMQQGFSEVRTEIRDVKTEVGINTKEIQSLKQEVKVNTLELETVNSKLNKVAEDNNFKILEINGDLDHIHLLIECSPQHYIPDMIKALKGVSARLLLKEYPQIKKKLWGGHMWNPSYFIATVSENTEDQIKNYILSQKEK